MKFADKLKFAVRLPITWLQRIFYSKPYVMSDLETIKYIRENRCSIARFGDGELDLMYGASIKFQRADKSLKRRLKEVAKSDNNGNCLVCIPDILLSAKQLKEKFILKDAKWWHKHLIATRGLWHKNFRAKFYGDATLTRFYAELNDKDRAAEYVNELKTLWEGQDVVFVEGYNSRLGMGNDLFGNVASVRRILCPSDNAFCKYREILSTVLKNTTASDLIICALGPTATVLSYELSNNDRRALDLGHVDIEYEWFKMGAQVQVAVPGKDMGEVDNEFSEIESLKPTNVIAEVK